MNSPEQLNDELTPQSLDDVPMQADDEAIEIAADLLEHVAGGTGGGGGVTQDP